MKRICSIISLSVIFIFALCGCETKSSLLEHYNKAEEYSASGKIAEAVSCGIKLLIERLLQQEINILLA